jgi:multidrug efflux system outer membrane protein
MKRTAAVTLLFFAITGCTMGPRYKRPTVDVPAAHRGFEERNSGKTDIASLAHQKWWELFEDPQLQQLERTAI